VPINGKFCSLGQDQGLKKGFKFLKSVKTFHHPAFQNRLKS